MDRKRLREKKKGLGARKKNVKKKGGVGLGEKKGMCVARVEPAQEILLGLQASPQKEGSNVSWL